MEEKLRLSKVDCLHVCTRLLELWKWSGYQQTAVSNDGCGCTFQSITDSRGCLKEDGFCISLVSEDFCVQSNCHGSPEQDEEQLDSPAFLRWDSGGTLQCSKKCKPVVTLCLHSSSPEYRHWQSMKVGLDWVSLLEKGVYNRKYCLRCWWNGGVRPPRGMWQPFNFIVIAPSTLCIFECWYAGENSIVIVSYTIERPHRWMIWSWRIVLWCTEGDIAGWFIDVFLEP